ncbi:hypothetical protein GBAR_LOCUS24231, partial [Geodia barretti]
MFLLPLISVFTTLSRFDSGTTEWKTRRRMRKMKRVWGRRHCSRRDRATRPSSLPVGSLSTQKTPSLYM